jgi:hypothetical protein
LRADHTVEMLRVMKGMRAASKMTNLRSSLCWSANSCLTPTPDATAVRSTVVAADITGPT